MNSRYATVLESDSKRFHQIMCSLDTVDTIGMSKFCLCKSEHLALRESVALAEIA